MISVVVDENIPYASEAFGRLGAVRVLPGRRIAPDDLKDADVLIVRSVTRVDGALLSGAGVRFVGTATIGCDHVDVPFLAARGIGFASAPGSNANSVAEYVVAALLASASARGRRLEGATLAVVGVGNVGSRVVEKAQALGMRCRLNDPPRRRASGDPAFVDLDQALADADYVTLHVPLEREGPDATAGLAGRRFFETLPPGAVFVNTSRGAVVDEAALAAALDSGRLAQAVLDVWRGEPEIDRRMVRRAFLGTPHIAGYSFDGKVAATATLYAAVCGWLGRAANLDLAPLLPPPEVPRIDLTAAGSRDDEDLLRSAVSAVYDIRADDRALREAAAQEAHGAEFDRLRRQYRRRREFPHTTVAVRGDGRLAGKAAGLGFGVERQ